MCNKAGAMLLVSKFFLPKIKSENRSNNRKPVLAATARRDRERLPLSHWLQSRATLCLMLSLAAGSTMRAGAAPRDQSSTQPKATDTARDASKETAKGNDKGPLKVGGKDKSPKSPEEDSEVRLGRENAEENDKQVKLVTDSALVERVNRIGQELADAANKYPIVAMWGSPQLKQFKYSFKIVDEKDVNAYSLPGGFVYVNKGLIDYVHSDDELAGVLAHEITHAAHHHMLKLIREQRKMEKFAVPLQALAIGAVLLARGGTTGESAQNLMLATQLYMTAKLNTYGIEAEKDADHGGLLLMTHTHYNPVGLYSFMLRLAQYEKRGRVVEMGYLQTHPPAPERVAAAKAELNELNIPIHLSDVDPELRSVVATVSGTSMGMVEIKMRGITVCRVAGIEGQTAQERGTKIAKRLNGLLDEQLQPFEIRVSNDKTRILVRGIPMLLESDAAAQNKTLEALAHEMGDAIAQINQRRQIDLNQ